MCEDLIKKLTGKNKNDYEHAAEHLVNNADINMFRELAAKDDFLFDFVKQNVNERLSAAVTDENYKNIFALMKVYSPSYEDFIINTLVKYANEDISDKMLNLLESGSVEEKIYSAKYFSRIQDPLAIDALRTNAFSDNEFLNINCAIALGQFGDNESFNTALKMLDSADEFEQLSGVKFLSAYGDISAVPAIINSMKVSSMNENIAGEIPYLMDLFQLLDNYYDDALLVLNNIINGLGEILALSLVLDFELFEVFERLIYKSEDSKAAVVLLNAQEKFNTLTENDEYLFDEDKDTKNEVYDIKKLLSTIDNKKLEKLIYTELNEESPFVYTALDFATDLYAIRELLKSNNQTLILKTAEVLKKLDNLDENTKTVALLKVTDTNIKSIIRAL